MHQPDHRSIKIPYNTIQKPNERFDCHFGFEKFNGKGIHFESKQTNDSFIARLLRTEPEIFVLSKDQSTLRQICLANHKILGSLTNIPFVVYFRCFTIS